MSTSTNGAQPARASLAETARRLHRYFLPHRRRWLTAAGALAFVHASEVLIPLQLRTGVDALARGTGGIARHALGLLALAALRLGVLHFGRRRNALVSTDVAFALREDLFAQLTRLDRDFYGRQAVGDLLSRATQDVDAIRRFFRSAVHRLISLVAVAVVAPVYMASQSTRLTLVLAPLLGLSLLLSGLLAARIRSASARVQAGLGGLTEAVQQNLRGIRTVQLHGQEASELAALERVTAGYAREQTRLLSLNAALVAVTMLTSGLTTCTVVYVGGRAVLDGTLSIGTLTGFLFYLTMLLGVLRESNWPVYGFLSAMAGAERIFAVLDAPPAIDDRRARRELVSHVRGVLDVREVWYRYPARGDTTAPHALCDVSLSVAPGELVALVGPVGSGKSTLLRCLARQFDPDAGEVTLDGRALPEYPLATLRQVLTLVSQDCWLMAASLGENIAFDDPARESAQIARAARAAALAGTIAKLPAGLATPVGERGVKLSGGQRQRTGLARGLIRETPVLLLDDCLSALDAKTEARVLSALDAQRAGRATVIVTHRASTARRADRIYVLDAGRVVEAGRHDALVALGGHYARLVRSDDRDGRATPLHTSSHEQPRFVPGHSV